MFMQINEAQVMNTWGEHLKSSLGIVDESKLAWMSKYAYLHDLHDKQMLNESVDGHAHLNPNMNIGGMGAISFPSAASNNAYDRAVIGSGDNVYSVLPLALQVAAQTIALDLVPVVPLQGPHGLLQYLDFVYEGGRLNNAGGSKYTSPTYGTGANATQGNMASPYMIKALFSDAHNSADDATAGATTSTHTPYTFVTNTKYKIVTGVTAETGTTAPTGGTINGEYELTYIYPNRIDGSPLFRVVEKAYNSQNMLGGENASTPIYELLKAGTVYLVLSTVTGTPAAADLITVTSRGLEEVRAFEDHVTSFSGQGFLGDEVDSNNPYTREEGEATPGRKLGLKSYTIDVKAQTLQVDSAITREQVQDLKQFGIDAISQAEAALVNELTQGINKIILEKMYNLGAKNATQLESVEGHNNVSAYFTNGTGAPTTATIELGKKEDGTQYTTTINYTNVTGGGEVMGTIQRRIMTKILAASNIIAVRGRRGAGTFAVCSGNIGTTLQDCAGFIPYPLSNTISANGNSLYPIGALAGISIYVDPNMKFDDLRVCVGRKGKENEPGIVFMPYLMADKVETTSEFTMAPVISLKSRFAVVEAGIYPQTQYYTFGIALGDGVSLI